MKKLEKSEKAKFFVAVMSESDFEAITGVLEDILGRIDVRGEVFNFNYTDYYREEMGENLKKRSLSLEKLKDREELVGVKHLTRKLEEKYAVNKRRRYNIDPGYLTLNNVVLATSKDHPHRIYLGSGVFAQVTLIYSRGEWEPLHWTYPDYTSKEAKHFFHRARQSLIGQ